MQVLPLKFIRDFDKKIVGPNLFNLAKLNHLGLPVVESVIVLPPIDSVKKILHKYSRHGPITENKNNIKQEILSLEIPENLKDIHQGFAFDNNKLGVNVKKLWDNLLEKWATELISKIERQEQNNLNLTPQQVVLSYNFSSIGSAFFDETQDRVEVRVDSGKLDFKLSEEIEKIVLLGNKKLVLPQVYYWANEGAKIKIIKLLPYTDYLPQKEKPDILKTSVSKKVLTKTATKIILNFKDEVLNSLDTDLVMVQASKAGVEEINKAVTKIAEFGESKIIFFPGFDSSQTNNLEFAKSFLFFKNKKNLNCQIVLPQTFSVDEFLSLKREYASLGIYSKGNLKIWKQFTLVSDFLNVDEYLDAGFDGAIIDLDKIVKVVNGVDSEIFVREPRSDWIKSLEMFLEKFGFLKLVKNEKPVIVLGGSLTCEEILGFFIKSGVWAIAAKPNIIDSLREHISYLEKTLTKFKRKD